ncbi:arylesterase [Noviherbaspirillum saxi]|uniref:Arylesterase n=1 Tax=Noviherbaspirillum saxi TaxID=2320863 RepID=A0A3A3FV69_9BURK|nr:arylesterase [Noviherbaspirillum saxi]RJF98458.1 arylesterase [Noviherbaspirillum saxi]
MRDNGKKYKSGINNLRWLAALSFFFFATCAYSASKTVLVLGDSLSAEYGLARGSGWVSLLEQRLKQSKIDAVIVNASISGETTSGGKARLPALLGQHRPDIVIVELGANDGLRGLPVASAEGNLRDMINASRKAKANVLLVGMQIPPNYGREYTQKFSGMYEKLSKETKISFAPFLLQGVANQPKLFQSDRIHPLAEAQPIILENIWPYLKPLLGK